MEIKIDVEEMATKENSTKKLTAYAEKIKEMKATKETDKEKKEN